MSFNTARMAEIYTEAGINVAFRASDTREPDEAESELMDSIQRAWCEMFRYYKGSEKACPKYRFFLSAIKALRINQWWVTLEEDGVKFEPWKWASFTRENVESDLDRGSGWVLMRRCDDETPTGE